MRRQDPNGTGVPSESEHLALMGPTEGDLGQDATGPDVLEVAQLWQGELLDVKHYPMGTWPVTIGAATGYRWRLLGIPVAEVPRGFARLSWVLGPAISQANEEWLTEFCAPTRELPSDSFALFRWSDEGFVCDVHPSWRVTVEQWGLPRALESMIAEGQTGAGASGTHRVRMDADTRVVVEIGETTFVARQVPPGRRVASRLSENIDYPFLGVMSLVAFVALMLAVVIVTSPAPGEPEINTIPERFAEVMLQPSVDPPKKLQQPAQQKKEPGESARAEKEAGQVGKRDSTMKVAKGGSLDKRKRDMEVVEKAGALGVMADAGFEDVFGSGALHADLTAGLGGLLGDKGNQQGTGLFTDGRGIGGGGVASTGGVGTRARGGGDDTYGSSGGNLGDKTESGGLAGMLTGDPITVGGLGKAEIDRVVKRHMSQLRYCYQREVTRDPTLAGKVTMSFVIAKDGSVSKAGVKRSSLDNNATESCLERWFSKMTFPEPKGGGIVMVSYPLMFSL